MKPIINPWLFYLAEISENVSTIALITLIASICTFIAIWIFFLDSSPSQGEENFKKTTKKSKTLIYWIVLSAFLLALTPSKETCYQMMVATVVTPDNISATTNGVKDLVSYIVDSADDVINSSKSNKDDD